MIRTFIAVELPQRFIPEIEKIEFMLNTPGIKLVEPAQVHITLKFLGDISEDNVEPIASALSQVSCKPFEARIKGVGVFPKPAYIKVIWFGAEGNFEALHSEVERVLAPFNFEKDDRFSPHATLARVKQLRDKAKLLEKIKELEDIDLGSMNVESISLKKSTLTPQGPIYETLREIKLQ
ncbi:MAG: RNA 2',3'-cyclic phosphodiesterase [Euryarchaeota archaeon]|nr:RNA 2',3'-cyclic phosphodiesterase [Euryarchaeota archaeon]MBU4491367.1 RNA 2',3'-cyclic phosphodiesterase [Euryarchaeota archaeon]MCG2728623.1 RNA 2',3'-cyclic phosphodiesterase [Candidatus Methanoperedenaceae archaeon]